MTSKQVTLPPWNSRKLVHSKEMVWAWRWSVALAHSIGKFFLCYIGFFSSETSAPGSPGNYLYLYAFIKGKHHNHQNYPISEKVPGSIPRRSPSGGAVLAAVGCVVPLVACCCCGCCCSCGCCCCSCCCCCCSCCSCCCFWWCFWRCSYEMVRLSVHICLLGLMWCWWR